jgi:drug/metabolite transporter (DMT)-like permease
MEGLVKSHIALFIVNLMYGANYVIAKGLMPNVIGPNGFILLRVIGAVLLFWLIYSFQSEKIARKDFIRLAVCGLFGVAMNQLLFFNGLMLTSPLNAPVIMTMTPILVLVFSVIILKEKARIWQVVGMLIGAGGSIVFMLQNSGGFATQKGDLFILLNAASYAVYLVLVKPLMKKYRPLTVITWVFTFGLVYVLCWQFSLEEVQSVNWANISSESITRMLFVIIGVTFLPYLLTVFAMKKVSPSVAAVYIYLQPLLAAFFVYLFWVFGMEDYTEKLNMIKIASALAVFLGVYLVIRRPKKGVAA